MLVCFKIRRISKLLGLSDAFWIRLRFPRYSLWNKDLLDAHLGLLNTDITSKNFVCLRDVLKTSSRYVFKTSSRHVFKDTLREVLKTSSRCLGRRKIVTLKTCWRHLQDVLKTNRCFLCSMVYKLFWLKSIWWRC